MWFSWDYEDGFITHRTAEEARAAAEKSLDGWREHAIDNGEWAIESGGVCWGKVVQEAVDKHIDEGDQLDMQLMNVKRDSCQTNPTSH